MNEYCIKCIKYQRLQNFLDGVFAFNHLTNLIIQILRKTENIVDFNDKL